MIRRFFRHLIESLKSLKRNGWMTIAAVSSVMITLSLVAIFASVIANITYTMNLQMVIIGGEYTGFGSILVDETRRVLEEIPLPTPKVTTPFYTNSAMYGAFKFGADNIIAGLI